MTPLSISPAAGLSTPSSTNPADAPDRAQAVRDYHQRSKHALNRYAAGPETLDWDAQPDPFRRYAGAPVTLLPLPAEGDRTAWHSLFDPGAIAPHPAALESVGLLFELSFALSAWKEHGPDRWAVRCTPSSGNLHPTEVYLLATGVPDLADGLYHYVPREHGLELRARLPLVEPEAGQPRLLMGMSSIHWREAWKYGERAFRYCQLDMGHAIGAMRYACAVLGWRTRALPLADADIARLLGLDRDQDFGSAEHEEPEALYELQLAPAQDAAAEFGVALSRAIWSGRANRLDARPMYQWPAIDHVARATRRPGRSVSAPLPALAPRFLLPSNTATAASLIRSRRSAQSFDRKARMDAVTFWALAAALMPRQADGHATLPWDAWPAPARVHPVMFVHRVDCLAPGAYLLMRDQARLPALQAALPDLAWQPVAASPPHLPFYQLAGNPALAGTLRTLICHQAIGADAMVVLALLAEFDAAIADGPGHYRDLLREAGLIGQVLYLEAEAAGLRGTGIGCYFDDPVHELLGLHGTSWQVLYHFSVGLPVVDPRILTTPPYGPERTHA